jgi:hypothetical protein
MYLKLIDYVPLILFCLAAECLVTKLIITLCDVQKAQDLLQDSVPLEQMPVGRVAV